MADEENASVGEKASLRDHLDNPLIFLLAIAIFTYAIGCAGRAAGNRAGAPGVTAFFGG